MRCTADLFQSTFSWLGLVGSRDLILGTDLLKDFGLMEQALLFYPGIIREPDRFVQYWSPLAELVGFA